MNVQLADRSIVYLKGVFEDVLIQVSELIFSDNFIVLHMEDDYLSKSSAILLGRSFLKTAKTIINVDNGILIMKFDGKIIKFDIYDATRHPSDTSLVYSIYVVKPIN